MSDAPKQTMTTDLQTYSVQVEWHAPGQPETHKIVARSAEDAKAIAVLLFRKSRTPECVIDAIAITGTEPLS